MRIDGLSLDFFRNYVHLDAAFDPEINVIYGDNAQGKTNLLEAVAYLSGVSHRARYDRELIQFGVDHAFLKGHVFARERDFLLEAELHRGARRVLRSNGVKLKNGGELSGIFQSVLFCPEDLYLIREGAAARRGFLDDCICQLRPRYALALAEYKRLHEHKTRILRDSEEKPSLLDALDEFSMSMAKAGALLVRVVKMAAKEGLSGLEFASGIPGTIGGAMVMNAGAYGGEIKDVVTKVRVLLPDGTIRDYTGEEMAFGYRRSRVIEEQGIVLEAELELKADDPETIAARMEALREKRVAKQPLEYASAGSTFKRPEGYFAGKLIEDAGLRGFSVGDAQVSEKHCGFVINRGNATASEIMELIQEVQKRVYEQSGVRLEPEVKLLGF